MVRTQIQLDEDTYQEVRGLAFRSRVSMSEIVRRALRKGLGKEAKRRSRARLAFVGAGASGRGDVSERHDYYLAEDPR